MKPIKELNPSRWIICSANRRCRWGVHWAILPLVELKGYPVYAYSQLHKPAPGFPTPQNRGTADLLRVEEGYDVRDGDHLSELNRQQAAGNPVYSMARTEAEANANVERQHRAEIIRRAQKFGIKTVASCRVVPVRLAPGGPATR